MLCHSVFGSNMSRININSFIAASCNDLSIICGMQHIDPDKQLQTCMTCGCTFGEYEAKMLYTTDEYQRLFRTVRRKENLELTPQEMALVIPYVFFAASKTQAKSPLEYDF